MSWCIFWGERTFREPMCCLVNIYPRIYTPTAGHWKGCRILQKSSPSIKTVIFKHCPFSFEATCANLISNQIWNELYWTIILYSIYTYNTKMLIVYPSKPVNLMRVTFQYKSILVEYKHVLREYLNVVVETRPQFKSSWQSGVHVQFLD